MSKQELFIGKNRASESLDSILSILECVLNLSQSFYEEISVIRILEPSFAVKESFAYRYHERFLFEVTFKSLLIQNFRY